VPHQPFAEQQLPKLLPRHVYPPAPPQLASGDTFFVGIEAGGEAARVDDVRTAVEDGFEVAPLLAHVPNAELQPVPQ
jgi:transposase InsO family protein